MRSATERASRGFTRTSTTAAVSTVTFVMLAALASCAPFRDDAQALLDRGRYGDALDELVQEERAAAHYGERARARYALYRGLVHLALGDAPATDRWLSEAKARFDADPRALSPMDAGRLLDAWQSLGRGL